VPAESRPHDKKHRGRAFLCSIALLLSYTIGMPATDAFLFEKPAVRRK